MIFEDRDEAELWIIKNQLGRRNVAPIDKIPLAERMREILEKQAKERHKILSGTRSGKGQAVVNLPQPDETKTRDKLAAVVGVSGRTYDALRQVTEQGTPELVQAVRDKRLGAATAAEVSKLPEEEQREIASKETRAILFPELEEAAKQSENGEEASPQSEDLKTSEKLAEQHGVSRATVERAAQFAAAADKFGLGAEVATGLCRREKQPIFVARAG